MVGGTEAMGSTTRKGSLSPAQPASAQESLSPAQPASAQESLSPAQPASAQESLSLAKPGGRSVYPPVRPGWSLSPRSTPRECLVA
jgi:hypothetical protein